MSPISWDPGYYAAKDAAEDAEIRRLHEIGNRAHQRGVARTLDHYSELAAAASVPELKAVLVETRDALSGFTEWVSDLGDTMSPSTSRLYLAGLAAIRRIDDALRSQP